MNEWILSSTVLIFAICAIRMVVKGKIGLRLQYALWALVLLRLLVPVNFFQSDISVTNLASQVQIADETTQIQFSAPEVEEVHRPVQMPVTGEQQLPQGVAPSTQPTVPPAAEPSVTLPPVQQPTMPLPPVTENADEQVVAGDTVTDHVASKPDGESVKAQTQIPWADIAFWCWVGGMVIMVSFLIFTNVRFYLRLRRSRQALAIPFSPVRVFVTGAIQSPCLFGLGRPAIYLPTAVAEDYDALQHVYAHELTHYYHLDFIWSVLRSVCLVIHWYNPLVWLAAKLSRQDAEMACDEGALKRIGEDERADYGRTLIHLTCRENISGMLVAATTMTGGKKEIKERITLLMKKPRTAVYSAIVLALVTTILVGCTFTGRKEANNDTAQTEPTVEYVGEELTEEELQEFEQMFSRKYTQGTSYLYYSMALQSAFACPEEVGLADFFFYGFPDEVAGPEEREKLLEIVEETEGTEILYGWQVSDIRKIPRARMNQALKACIGLSLEETDCVDLDFFKYLEETDSYYTDGLSVAGTDEVDVFRGIRTEDGRVILSYYREAHDTHDVFEGKVTLVEAPEGSELPYHVYSNDWRFADTAETETVEPQIQELPEAELQVFEMMFSGSETYGTEYQWYNMALLSTYSCPEDVDLSMLFYNGFKEETVTPEEVEKVIAIVREENGEQEAEWWQSADMLKVPKAKMDQVLRTYFGRSLGGTNCVNLQYMVYLEETDSYYTCATDYAGIENVDFTSGYITEDGAWLVLRYDHIQYGTCELKLAYGLDSTAIPLLVYSNMPCDPQAETNSPQ